VSHGLLEPVHKQEELRSKLGESDLPVLMAKLAAKKAQEKREEEAREKAKAAAGCSGSSDEENSGKPVTKPSGPGGSKFAFPPPATGSKAPRKVPSSKLSVMDQLD
jgi:septal ring factor EnvC (AmiA/AmiB activator)